MRKKLLGVCGFLLFGTFGMLSGVAQVHHDERITPSETVALQGDGLQRQEMSDEELRREIIELGIVDNKNKIIEYDGNE